MTIDGQILLGTVAIEPNRWAMVDPEWGPTIRVSEWHRRIAAAGFDGLELWEKHLSHAGDAEAERVLSPDQSDSDATANRVQIFNSYVSFDSPAPDARQAVAGWAARTECRGVKFNVGNDRKQELAYGERIREWLEMMPTGTTLLCECHHGISIAEEPKRAARIFEASGTVDEVQAIVHTHESADHIRERFDAYGDRITHIHVNYLDFETGTGAPKLRAHRKQLEADVELLRSLGFAGSWTIEFANGVLDDNNDHPEFLLASAADDLAVLREVLS